MRRLRALLLATTSIVTLVANGTDAEAMPFVVPFVAGAASAIAGTAPLVLGGAAAATSSFAAGAFAVQSIVAFGSTALGSVLVNSALGFALNALAAGVFGQKPPRPKAQDVQSNFMLGDQPRLWCRGPTRVGGGVILAEEKEGTLYKLIAHADTEVTQHIQYFLNDVAITNPEAQGGHVTDSEFIDDDDDPYYRLYWRDGTIDQTAMPVLRTAFGDDWPATAVGAGVNDTLLTLDPVSDKHRGEILSNRGILGLGEPDISQAAWRGRDHDPRDPNSNVDDPTTWPASTGNPALVWASHRVETERFATPSSGINWDIVATAANVCDEQVLDRDNAPLSRYRIGINVVKSEESNTDAEARILAAMDAILVEDEEGRVGPIAGKYVEPTVTLTDDDIISLSSVPPDDGETNYTHWYAQYAPEEADWKDAVSAVWIWPGWSAGYPIRSNKVQLNQVYKHNQAIRLLKRAAYRDREPDRLIVTAGLRGVLLRRERYVRIDLESDPTLDGVYEVATRAKDPGGVMFALSLIRTSADLDDLAAGEEGEPPNSDTDVTSSTPVTNIAEDDMNIQPASVTLSGGVSAARFVATFPAPTRSDLRVEIEYREAGTANYEQFQVETSDGIGASNVVSDGQTYEFRWRIVGHTDWSAIVTRVAVADATAPSALTSILATGGVGQATVSFTTSPEQNYSGAQIYRADYSSGYSGPYDFVTDGAALVRTEYGTPGQADNWTNTGLAAGHSAYWVEPINGSNVAGARSGPFTVDVT